MRFETDWLTFPLGRLVIIHFAQVVAPTIDTLIFSNRIIAVTRNELHRPTRHVNVIWGEIVISKRLRAGLRVDGRIISGG